MIAKSTIDASNAAMVGDGGPVLVTIGHLGQAGDHSQTLAGCGFGHSSRGF
jgi:hypothetical protein